VDEQWQLFPYPAALHGVAYYYMSESSDNINPFHDEGNAARFSVLKFY
jgi:hypothetical protein